MTTLNSIPVLFNQEEHTYLNTRTGKYLQGITSTLVHRVNPNKYAGAPDHILKAAAERGSKVHEEIELAETIGIEPSSQEGRNYLKLKEGYKLNFLQSEYTVSDLEHYATNIDAIYEVEENVVDIADYKTTSKFDKESVSWQLSICAHFLEMNNPHVKVRRLLGIWLRDDIADLIVVERKPDSEIEALIDADLNDKPFSFELIPDNWSSLECQFLFWEKKRLEAEDNIKSVKENMMLTMKNCNLSSVKTGETTVSYIPQKTSKRFDSATFKKENPELYNSYQKEVDTPAQIRILQKDKNTN